MSEPIVEQLVAMRKAQGLSQLDVAEASWCDLRAVDDLEDGDGPITVVAAVASALGAQLQVVGEDGIVLGNLGWSMKSLPVVREDGDVLGAVQEVAAVAQRRRRGAAPCHAEISNHYREAVEALWGRTMTVHDRWREMPLVEGTAISLAPHRGDVLRLVRTRRWRQDSVLATSHVAPAGLDAAHQETYRVLRRDGVTSDEAAAIVTVV